MRISTMLVTAASVIATSAVGGLASAPAVRSAWYAQLRKPAYQPPRQFFPVVWPALYADIAVVSAMTVDHLSDAGELGKRRGYQGALALNLVLNASWSWLFFNRRRYASSALLSTALTLSSADLACRAIDVSGRRAVPLVLYPLWCAFASLLSAHIALLNRGA